MKLDNLNHINQLQDFLTGSQPIAFEVAMSKDERYRLISKLLARFGYAKLSPCVVTPLKMGQLKTGILLVY